MIGRCAHLVVRVWNSISSQSDLSVTGGNRFDVFATSLQQLSE